MLDHIAHEAMTAKPPGTNWLSVILVTVVFLALTAGLIYVLSNEKPPTKPKAPSAKES